AWSDREPRRGPFPPPSGPPRAPPLISLIMATREFEGAAALEGFPNAWKRVMTDPRAFFAEMPEVGGLQAPLAFLGVTAVINAAGHLVFGWGLGGFVRVVLVQVLCAFVAVVLFLLVAQYLF